MDEPEEQFDTPRAAMAEKAEVKGFDNENRYNGS